MACSKCGGASVSQNRLAPATPIPAAIQHTPAQQAVLNHQSAAQQAIYKQTIKPKRSSV